MAAAIRLGRFGIVLLVPILAILLVWCFLPRLTQREIKLKDGSSLRLEKITYGVRDTNYIPLGFADMFRIKFGPILPKFIQSRFFTNPLPTVQLSWAAGYTLHNNVVGLNLWFTRRDTHGKLVDVNIGDAELLDSHGDVFFLSKSGGNMFGRPGKATGITVNGYIYPQANLAWLTFEGFPRHEKRIRLRLGERNGAYLGEFTVDNPDLAPQEANWPARALPATNVEGRLSFALTHVSLQSNPAINEQLTNLVPGEGASTQVPRTLAPSFEVREDGILSTEWKTASLEGWDSSSNYATRRGMFTSSLDPGAKAWKLTVSFYGTEHSALASNEVAVFTNIPVPQPGEILSFNRSLWVSSRSIQLLALCGPGEVTFSNHVPVEAAKSTDLTPSFTTSHTNRGALTYDHVRSSAFQLAVNFDQRPDVDTRTTIRAVDNLGREFYAGYSLYNSASDQLSDPHQFNLLQTGGSMFPYYYALNLPPDAKTVDLYFCVHHSHTEEFIFRPPSSAPP